MIKAKEEFEFFVKDKYPHLSEISGRSLLGICLLDNTPVFEIEQYINFLIIKLLMICLVLLEVKI